jgi:hypothetical protein
LNEITKRHKLNTALETVTTKAGKGKQLSRTSQDQQLRTKEFVMGLDAEAKGCL